YAGRAQNPRDTLNPPLPGQLSPARTDRRRRDRVSARTMDIKKITRNPLFYVLMIGFLLVVGFSLISSLGGAKQISTQEGLQLLAGKTVTEVVNTDGDQRVDMKLSDPYEGASDVQFYYVSARADEVVKAVDAANPKDGFNDAVPRATWFDGFLSLLLPIILLGLLFWFLMSSAQGGG